MYFYFAVAFAGFYIATARPGMMRDQDLAMIVAVAVYSMLGLVDSLKRR